MPPPLPFQISLCYVPDVIQSYLGNISVLLLSFFLGILASGHLALWSGLRFRVEWALPLALLFSYSVAGFVDRSQWGKPRRRLLLLSALFVVFVSVAFVSSAFVTVGGDATTDHFPTIHHLAVGWNPIYDPLVQKVSVGYYTGSEADYGVSIGKLFHFIGAAAYQLTGNIQSAKTLGWLWPPVVGVSIVYLGMTLGATRVSIFLFAAVCALAPGIINQSFAGYVDSSVLSLLILFTFSQLTWFSTREPRTLAIAVLSFLLFPHSKLSGLPLSLLFGVPLFVSALSTKAYRLRWVRGVVVLYLLLLGHPYGTNYYHFKNAFFPLPDTADKVRLMAASEDPSAVAYQMRPADAFFKTLTSESRVLAEFVPKPLWGVRKAEILAAGHPDARAGGAGPLFGLIFFLAVGLFLLFGWSRPASGQGTYSAWLWMVACCVWSVSVSPVLYWLRFIPPVFVLVLLVVAGLAWLPKSALQRRVGMGLMVLLLANSALVGVGTFQLIGKYQSRVQASLNLIRAYGKPVTVNFDGNRHAELTLLTDLRIPFVETKEPCRDPWTWLVFSCVCRPHDL
jgi:hypothetical protein